MQEAQQSGVDGEGHRGEHARVLLLRRRDGAEEGPKGSVGECSDRIQGCCCCRAGASATQAVDRAACGSSGRCADERCKVRREARERRPQTLWPEQEAHECLDARTLSVCESLARGGRHAPERREEVRARGNGRDDGAGGRRRGLPRESP